MLKNKTKNPTEAINLALSRELLLCVAVVVEVTFFIPLNLCRSEMNYTKFDPS